MKKKIELESYSQFMKEIKELYGNVKMIWFNDHRSMWTVEYENGISDDEFETLEDTMEFLKLESMQVD
jgi:hypothetical protein